MVSLSADQRRTQRFKVKNSIVNTPGGLGQTINFSSRGILFKCFKLFDFPSNWSLDIYDTFGLRLEQLQVRKIWQECLCEDNPSIASVIVGVEFEQPLLLRNYSHPKKTKKSLTDFSVQKFECV